LPAQPHPLLLKIWEAKPFDRSGEPGHILQADKNGIVIGCGTGALIISLLQREGGRRLTAAEFLAGHSLKAGEKVGIVGA
jgi:methionyl-tRNA formyltransferase